MFVRIRLIMGKTCGEEAPAAPLPFGGETPQSPSLAIFPPFPARVDKSEPCASDEAMLLPLPSLTRRLNAMAEEPGFGAEALRAELQRSHPAMLNQILEDAECPERFAAWGKSSNLERDADRELVHPALLCALCGLAGLEPPHNSVTNAGLLHTYGYLLSNRRTPFGFKRERWTQPVLETGLNLRPGLLLPVPRSGTLLGNVTALCQAVWKPGSADEPSNLTADGSPLLRSGATLIEQPETSSVRLLTRLIPFANPKTRTARAALFHAWEKGEKLQFITVFPVAPAALEKLKAQFQNGPSLVKPRFNSAIPGLGPEGDPGQRIVAPATPP
jgi:hypothetical protein